MKIEQKEITTEIVDIINVANYSEADIEKLIAEDLKKKGHKIKKISFDISSKSDYDEWGMNPVRIDKLEGAIVELS